MTDRSVFASSISIPFLFCFVFKDRKNTNNNGNRSGDELDEELGDFQLPLSMTPYASSTFSHNPVPTNEIPNQQSSSTCAIGPSSSQYNVVLHSNVNEPLLRPTNRFDLNLSLDKDYRNQLNRKANSLMTVYEQSSMNDQSMCESSKSETWRKRSPSTASDLTYKRPSSIPVEENPNTTHETVRKSKIYFDLSLFSFIVLGMIVN